MRIRTIKPAFWSDEAVGSVSPLARLTFIGTWTVADDYGNLDRSARQLKAQIAPYDDVDLEGCIIDLLAAGLLTEYSAGGKIYLHINGFEKHQRVDKRGPRRCPEPDKTPAPEKIPDESGKIPTDRNFLPRKVREGKVLTPLPPLPVDNSKPVDNSGRGAQAPPRPMSPLKVGTLAKKLGLQAHPGESMEAFRNRVEQARNGGSHG